VCTKPLELELLVELEEKDEAPLGELELPPPNRSHAVIDSAIKQKNKRVMGKRHTTGDAFDPSIFYSYEVDDAASFVDSLPGIRGLGRLRAFRELTISTRGMT